MSPTLHLTIHQIVANQLWDDDPPEAWETARRLQKLEYDRHEILHMLGSAVSHELWSSLQGQPFDPDRYTTNLQALPESWEAQRQGQR